MGKNEQLIREGLKDNPKLDEILKNPTLIEYAEDLDKIQDFRRLKESVAGETLIKYLKESCTSEISKLRSGYTGASRDELVGRISKLDAQYSLLEEISTAMGQEEEIQTLLDEGIKELTGK